MSLYLAKQEIYFTLDLMDCDLHRVIQSQQTISEKHVKFFLKQILQGVNVLHQYGICHRNLQPKNILVRKDCKIQISSFECAKHVDERVSYDTDPMISHIVARFHASPQIILASIAAARKQKLDFPYSLTDDLWSIGNIIAELILRHPFMLGGNVDRQIRLMLHLAGYGGVDDFQLPLSDEMITYLSDFPPSTSIVRSQIVEKSSIHVSETLLRMTEAFLQVKPSARLTAAEALNHPYFLSSTLNLNDAMMNIGDELGLIGESKVLPEGYFDFEDEENSLSQLKQMIEDEVYALSANQYLFPLKETRQEIDERILIQDRNKRRLSKMKMKSHSIYNIIVENDEEVKQIAEEDL